MTDQSQFLDEVADVVFDRLASAGFEGLTEAERTFFLVWSAHGEIDNGGFDQFYYNSSGEYASHTPDAFRAIGIAALADCVATANAQFPSDPPADDALRQQQLDELTDRNQAMLEKLSEEFSTLGEDLDALLYAFAKANLETNR